MKHISLVIAAAVFIVPGAVSAADAEAGKAKTATCVACHGAEGISPNPLWPNLAGQKDQYLIKQMKAFRDGERSDPVMSPMAQILKEEDIDNVAAFYASQVQK